jgi:hypothetical protein
LGRSDEPIIVDSLARAAVVRVRTDRYRAPLSVHERFDVPRSAKAELQQVSNAAMPSSVTSTIITTTYTLPVTDVDRHGRCTIDANLTRYNGVQRRGRHSIIRPHARGLTLAWYQRIRDTTSAEALDADADAEQSFSMPDLLLKGEDWSAYAT